MRDTNQRDGQENPEGQNRKTMTDAEPRQPVEHTCDDRASFSPHQRAHPPRHDFTPTCLVAVTSHKGGTPRLFPTVFPDGAACGLPAEGRRQLEAGTDAQLLVGAAEVALD